MCRVSFRYRVQQLEAYRVQQLEALQQLRLTRCHTSESHGCYATDIDRGHEPSAIETNEGIKSEYVAAGKERAERDERTATVNYKNALATAVAAVRAIETAREEVFDTKEDVLRARQMLDPNGHQPLNMNDVPMLCIGEWLPHAERELEQLKQRLK